MKRRSAILVLAGAMSLLVIGVGLWFATMPYPISLWLKACVSVRYSAEWPISWLDFVAAKRLVKPHLDWREIITGVTVAGPDEIRISTTSLWKHMLWARGQIFIIRKVNGKWVIVEKMSWMS
ncbi:MAG: hypothetical protein WBE46_06865 [Dehalococcoidia bacterium]